MEIKKEKAKMIREILRMRFIEKDTYKEITEKIGISRPTARKYIEKFKEIVSEDDYAIKDYYGDLKRRVSFPARWNKYVKVILKDYAHHPKTVATSSMKRKIINTASPNAIDAPKSAMETYRQLRHSNEKTPSYETIAKIYREYYKKK